MSILELPFNDYLQYFGPDFRLDVPSTNMENLNTREYLEKVKLSISCVQMGDDLLDPDQRLSKI